MMAYNTLIHAINRRIARSLPYRGRVLDLGCGTAPYRDDILAVAEAYIGVDWPRSLHGSDHVDLFASLAEPLPFRDGCADTVTCFQVLEHLPEPGAFLAECHRVLRPGGVLLITVPFMWHLHEAPYDYFRYTRHGLEYLLARSGFAEVTIRENTGYWQMCVLKFNYHTARREWGPLWLLWWPVWWLGQAISPVLDRLDPHPEETASYTVIARKA